MAKLSKDDYEVIVNRLMKAGYTVETVYEALESAGFSVEIDGEVYNDIFASRVLAMMHSRVERVSLKL